MNSSSGGAPSPGVQTVAVVGAGLMGHALAVVHAIGGLRVNLYDQNPQQLQRSKGLVAEILSTLQSADELDSDAAKQALQRIVWAGDLAAALDAADLVVEAVTERPQIKQQVYEDIDRLAPERAIIASNTSYLDIFPFIAARRQPYAVIAHWYTPPYIVDLVDVVPGPETLPEIMQTIAQLYRRMGKHPVVFERFIAGYIANRLQSALNLEALRLIEEYGLSHADIDDSIRHGLALRLCTLGQMRKADFTGLEMVRNGLASKAYQPPPATGRSGVLDALIAKGRTGIFSGAGFYDYGDTPAAELLRQRDVDLLKLKKTMQTLNAEQAP